MSPSEYVRHRARRRRHLAATLLAGAIVTSLAEFAQAAGVSAEERTDPIRVVALVNQVRTSLGVAPLIIDDELTTMAVRWSERMRSVGNIAHNNDLPADVTFAWRALGENVGVGVSVDQVHEAFMESPSHYQNLVDPRFERIGVGVVTNGNQIYLTERFAAVGSPSPIRSLRLTDAATLRPPPGSRKDLRQRAARHRRGSRSVGRRTAVRARRRALATGQGRTLTRARRSGARGWRPSQHPMPSAIRRSGPRRTRPAAPRGQRAANY